MWNEGIIGGLVICLLITVVLLISSRRIWCIAKESDEFPPGPFSWPIIGHLHLMLSNLPHQVLRDVAKRHGDVVGLRLGQQRAVVLSSPELAKEVLLTHDNIFADRPPFQFNSLMLFGSQNGIAFARYGPQWRKHRKICTLHLFTVKRLQELQYVRQEEIGAFLQFIHDQSRGGTAAVDLGKCAGQLSSRLLMRLVQSRPCTRVGGEDLQLLIKEVEQEVGPTVGDLIPCLSWLDFLRKQRMRRLHSRLEKIYAQMLKAREERASLHDDLICALLSQEEALTVNEINSVLHDMLGAGIHTTALTLEWVIAELLRNPHCLHRLQKEIDTQLGVKKQVREDDLPKLRYLQCIVKESLRLHPVAPLLAPRMSTKECKVRGYTIPANTVVLVNVWAIGRDERVWPDADKFMPERFEGKEVDVRGQHFELLPFGSGRRICLGLPLALSIIEVTLASLVSSFDLELPSGETHTSINMDGKKGFTANKATPVIVIPKLRA